ncbi:MAG: ferredoxin III, nif-specific [Gammaproteobacteria bacterium]|nr:ferredoxin III, nif-specific [Gammaproteobacteria bacterium]
MSENITGITRGGREWTPAFVTALDQKRCIGCGRCFKVCPRNVFELIEREEEIEDDDDDGFSDDTAMVMNLSDPMDCIGCEACSKVCPKDCHTHSPEPLAA